MICSREYVIKAMVRLLTNPKKKFSQNFLTDYSTCLICCDALENEKKIIEIGPGLGALTEVLVNSNKEVHAYEIDEIMIQHLKDYFPHKNNIEIHAGDFLKQDLSQYQNQNVSCISNIPYSITTPIIEKVIESDWKIKYFVFMVQKEAGSRLLAKQGSKDYGPLPIMLSYLGKIETVCKVTRDKFFPTPNVDSVVLKLTFRENRDYHFEKRFYQFLNRSFVMRRKTLLNNLKAFYPLDHLKQVLKNNNLSELVRPEELTLSDYLKIFNEL